MGQNETCSWDDGKRDLVLQARGIDFADLSPCFTAAISVTAEDKRTDYGERRYNMLVKLHGVILNITFTPRTTKYHLISARVASRKERRIYAAYEATQTR
jgi:uncharacterized protein